MNLLSSTAAPAIDVIIAVKDRPEVAKSVQSLLQIQAVAKVIICDGGSFDRETNEALEALEQGEKVWIVRLLDSGFNKARLLNQGILRANSEYVLVADADILWHTSTIEALLSRVASQSNLICHIQDVQESDSRSIALQRDRYTYQVRQHAEAAFVKVVLAEQQTQYRPGCGLICTRRETLLQLGGYQESFHGWGWEDQDLLIRAVLLGVQVAESGKVIHLSHSDELRNRYHNHRQPSQTRDRNILTCLAALTEGKLLGSLPVETPSQTFSKRIFVEFPNSLVP